MKFTNIAAYLSVMARRQPDTLAIVVQNAGKGYARYTYQELDAASERLARGLQAVGIAKGTRTVLMLKPGLEFFALVFALFKTGAVLVAVDPGMGLKNLGRCLADAAPAAFIGNQKAHVARLVLGWARDSIRKNIIVKPGLLAWLNMISLARVEALGSDLQGSGLNESGLQEPAAILFTSGSTGLPKGVNYTHGNFIAQVKALQALYQIQPGEVDLATFPLFALYAPAIGMTSLLPDMDFSHPARAEPGNIFAAIEDFSASTMFASPTLLDRVGKWGMKHKKKLPSLKRALCAGAPVAPDIIQRFDALLREDVQVFTPYGATEALPLSSIGSREVLGETAAQTAQGKGICVGQAVAGIELAIIRISDAPIADWAEVEPLASGEIGEIVVRGEQVTQAYYKRQEATALAKIHAKDGRLYHRMGDLGYQDAQGRLWFCGRKSERVVSEEQSYFTICCEGVFNVHPQVRRSALVRLSVNDEVRPGLCVELEAACKPDKRTLKVALLALGDNYAHTRPIRHIFFHGGFPVDVRHNAKIARGKLSRWAQKQL